MHKSLKWILNNIELILSALGLVLIVVVPTIVVRDQVNLWQAATITAVTVGLLHGTIFWLIRRRQRHLRDQALHEIKAMLNDVVKNQLAVIQMNAQLSGAQEKHLLRIQNSISQITDSLEHLSEESLVKWQSGYDLEALKSA